VQVFSSIIRQETAFFDKNKTGELINRLSADSQLVSQTVTQQVSSLIVCQLISSLYIRLHFGQEKTGELLMVY